MIFLLAAALMNVPPLPPSPADRRDAATALLQAVPIAPAVAEQPRRGAVWSTAYAIVGNAPKDEAVRAMVAARVTSHLAATSHFNDDVEGCVRDTFAYGYDVPTLQSMTQVITTAGGRALWDAALVAPLSRCYEKTVPAFLQYTGFASALRWFARERPRGPLPPYDVAASPAVLSAALTAYCGSATRDALVEIGGRLGVKEAWNDRKRNRGASTCLVASARLAGQDLPILADDGRSTIVILTS